MPPFMLALFAFAVSPTDTASILAAADAFDRAQLAQDRPAMERMILDELVFIDGSGKRLNKRAFIDGWMTPGDRYDPLMLIDRTVTPSCMPSGSAANAGPSRTSVTSTACSEAYDWSRVRRRSAAPSRSRHQPSGRRPCTRR